MTIFNRLKSLLSGRGDAAATVAPDAATPATVRAGSEPQVRASDAASEEAATSIVVLTDLIDSRARSVQLSFHQRR